MVTTRKKPRISYQEITKSDDEEEEAPVASTSTAEPPKACTTTAKPLSTTATGSTSANGSGAAAAVDGDDEQDRYEDSDDRDFQLTGRNYRKKGRKRKKAASVGPKKPVFDHARILELPADVLCNILSHLPLDNLFTLSISSRKFSTFLHSKTCASIWIDARKRLNIYAPKQFLNGRDYSTSPPQNPLRHFDFQEVNRPPGTSYDSILEDEMTAFEKEDEQFPIAVPAPPPGKSEFSVARYLFCHICYHCGKDGRASMIKVPELMAHFCKACWQNSTGTFKTVLADFEENLGREAYTEIPQYMQFLLTQPAWKPVHHETSYDREAALPPKERRIYLSNLQGKYEDFKAKKQAMTREEFEAWFAKTLQDHDEARKQAGSLSEYLWLKTTHATYASRMKYAIYARNEKALKEAVIERLGIEDDKVRKNVETVLSTHDNLLRSLPRTSRHLEENDWERLKPDLDKYLEAYTSWVESNPLCRYPELGHVVSSHMDSLVHDAALISAVVLRYHESLFLTLPTVKQIILSAPHNLDSFARRTWLRTRLTEERAPIVQDVGSLRSKIMKDLVRKWLLAEGRSVATLEDWSDAKLQEMLSKPEVYFTCTACDAKHITNGANIAAHPCTANDLGEKSYRNREWGIKDSACIPSGWQSERVELAEGFKGLYDLLESSARAKHTETVDSISRNPFRFPSSHSAIASDARWYFECKVEGCATGHQRLNVIMLHLAKHVREGKATLQQLTEEFKPVAKAPSYNTYGSIPAYLYDAISDEDMHGSDYGAYDDFSF